MPFSSYEQMLDGWLLDAEVQSLLAYMLHFPQADHQQKIRDLLPKGATALHAAALVRRATEKRFKLRSGLFSESWTANRHVALHTWLFHFYGGADAKLEPPPQPLGNATSQRVYNSALAAAAQLRKQHDALRVRMQQAYLSPDAFDAAVLELANACFDLQCLRLPADSLVAGTAVAAAAGGGGGDPADPATQERAARRASIAWQLACGTHP